MWALHYDHAIAVDFQNSGLVVQIYNHEGICLFETYARFCVWSCYLFEILFMIVLCYYSRCWFPYTRESKSHLDAQGKPYEIQSNSWWKVSFWTGVASLQFLDPPYLMMNPCINSHWVQSQYCWSETESWFESRWTDSGFLYGLVVIPFVLAELKFWRDVLRPMQLVFKVVVVGHNKKRVIKIVCFQRRSYTTVLFQSWKHWIQMRQNWCCELWKLWLFVKELTSVSSNCKDSTLTLGSMIFIRFLPCRVWIFWS